MWELTADNALDYLRETGRLSPAPARAEVLAGGVSNVVLRVEQEGRLLVVKQSRPQLRTRDAWFSDLDRVYREQEVMELLQPLLPGGVVPRVLFADRERYVLAMEHAPLDAVVWKAALLAGEADAAVAQLAGRILGLIHATTAARRDGLGRLADRRVFVQLRVEPFYRRIQERRPEVADAVEPLVADLMSAREALCHGDFSPKNLLVHRGGLTLVDYETGHLGEPAMDVGFFFSHLLLKTIKQHRDRGRYFRLIESALGGYRAAQGSDAVLTRGLPHLGVCVLARIDGTSPIDYLPQEGLRGVARRIGCWVLRERPPRWADVLARLEGELSGVGDDAGHA